MQISHVRRFWSRISMPLILVALPAAGFGNEPSEPEGSAGETSEHEFHRNWLAGFVGVTSEQRRDKGVALGVEYARRFTQSFSVGALAERTLGELDFWVFAMPFGYHAGPWKFYAGPGIESPDDGENEFLIRVGGEYTFEVNAWEIAPQLDIDFVDGDEALVFGVTVGKSF